MAQREQRNPHHASFHATTSARILCRFLRLAVVMLVIALLVLAVSTRVVDDRIPPDVSTISVVVKPSDSLWSLARKYSLTGYSTAQTVEVIRTVNDMSGSMVMVGEVLLVPIEVPESTVVASR